MIPFNTLDEDTRHFIKEREHQFNLIFNEAIKQFDLKNFEEAKVLFYKARSLAFFTGDGLRPKIMNEEADCLRHVAITEIIEKI